MPITANLVTYPSASDYSEASRTNETPFSKGEALSVSQPSIRSLFYLLFFPGAANGQRIRTT
jgi:hypothetical protein